MAKKNAISTTHPDAYIRIERNKSGTIHFRRHTFAHILEDTGEIAIVYRKKLYPIIGVNDIGDEVLVVVAQALARDKDDGRPIRTKDLRTAREIAALRKRSKLEKSIGSRLKDVLF
tara:strand:- start:328 stop:675 length:348 start_codon:yes stop_codon:yes gene_type:complete